MDAEGFRRPLNMEMHNLAARPSWQLPPGVSRGTWDYVQSGHIATDYDRFLEEHSHLKLDLEFVRQYLPDIPIGTPPAQSPLIADFGCGTGRVAKCFLPLGYRVVNVDLSLPMLKEAALKETAHSGVQTSLGQSVELQANLVELNCLRRATIDLAVCLFSSIGMIQGRKHRLSFLRSVCDTVKPGQPFIVHVHNRYQSLFDPGGWKWLAQSKLSSWAHANREFGDRVYAYRGLPAMFLHIFSRREILRDLNEAGFRSVSLSPLNRRSDGLLPPKTLGSGLRAGGFLAVARS